MEEIRVCMFMFMRDSNTFGLELLIRVTQSNDIGLKDIY